MNEAAGEEVATANGGIFCRVDITPEESVVAGGTSGINLGIAKRYAELGVRVAVVGRNAEKATAATEIGEGALGLSADVRDHGAIRGAMKRWGTKHEVAEAAVFLFTAAATYITGTVIDVDGGSQLGDATRAKMPEGA